MASLQYIPIACATTNLATAAFMLVDMFHTPCMSLTVAQHRAVTTVLVVDLCIVAFALKHASSGSIASILKPNIMDMSTLALIAHAAILVYLLSVLGFDNPGQQCLSRTGEIAFKLALTGWMLVSMRALYTNLKQFR